jgi:CHASE2 domain-containing sensor protein
MIPLAFEIYFSIKAFRNGWRARVFIPWAVMLATSFVIGFAAALEGQVISPLNPIAILLEVGLIVVLAYMAKHAPERYPTLELDTAERPAA